MQALGTGLGYSRVLPSNSQTKANPIKFQASWGKKAPELSLADQEIRTAEQNLVLNIERVIKEELGSATAVQEWLEDFEPAEAFSHVQSLKQRVLGAIDKQFVNVFDILAYPPKSQGRLRQLAEDRKAWELGDAVTRAKLFFPKMLHSRWLITDDSVRHYSAMQEKLGK